MSATIRINPDEEFEFTVDDTVEGSTGDMVTYVAPAGSLTTYQVLQLRLLESMSSTLCLLQRSLSRLEEYVGEDTVTRESKSALRVLPFER